MFDVCLTMLTQLIGLSSFLIPFILVMNLICSILFDRR